MIFLMRRQSRILLSIGAMAAILIVGYAIMYFAVYIVPLSGAGLANQLFYTVLLIALGLAVPYWVLKLVGYAAHKENPREKTVRLKDIAKDKDQLAHD
jgi:hypothetical protein